jgi:hypothetical protein
MSFGSMEASLKQIGQVKVLCGADQARNSVTGKLTGARM